MAIIEGAVPVGPWEAPSAERRPQRLLLVMVAIVAALALVASTSLFVQPSSANDVASEVAIRLNELNVRPAAVAPVIDDALQVRRSIVAGDFAAVNRIADGVLGSSQMQGWQFYPFDNFLAYVMESAPSEFASRLDEWVAKDVTDATPLLLRAQHSYDLGWAARGRGFADTVSARGQEQFTDYLNSALADINAALAISEANPFGFYLRLRILQSGGPSVEFFRAFADAIAKYPDYYPLYEIALATLQPRWGGTIPAMTGFVEDFAGDAPPSSPLKLLHLSLYRHLLSTAAVSCEAYGVDDDERPVCISQLMQDMGAEGLEPEVLDALALYDHTDKYQFGLAIKPIISDMLTTPGGDSYAGAVLELAARSMHSDTRLAQERPGQNDYIIDELVALSWEQKGFRANAEAKYREALAAAQNAAFPSEDEGNLAQAAIYQALSDDADDHEDYLNYIVFAKAAFLLGVPWRGDRICRGYYLLEDDQSAIASCTEALAATDNARALYWRGAAYSRSGQADEALADLKKVADDPHGQFKRSAAIDMSMIYFGRSDLEGALAVLNTYTFLYDPDLAAASQMAVAYNNRCYAYMELGELEKALADCTQSLRYGSIPDAFRKQQELVAQLGPSEAASTMPAENAEVTK